MKEEKKEKECIVRCPTPEEIGTLPPPVIMSDPSEGVPRYTYIFNEQIEQDTVQKMVDDLHNHYKIDIIFSGPGGTLSDMKAMVHYINGRKDDITLYLVDFCSSCSALAPLLYLECPVVITDDLDLIMFHVIDRRIYPLRKEGQPKLKYIMKKAREVNRKVAKQLELYLPKKLVKKFLKGHDVYLTRDEVVSWFGKKENIII